MQITQTLLAARLLAEAEVRLAETGVCQQGESCAADHGGQPVCVSGTNSGNSNPLLVIVFSFIYRNISGDPGGVNVRLDTSSFTHSAWMTL